MVFSDPISKATRTPKEKLTISMPKKQLSDFRKMCLKSMWEEGASAIAALYETYGLALEHLMAAHRLPAIPSGSMADYALQDEIEIFRIKQEIIIQVLLTQETLNYKDFGRAEMIPLLANYHAACGAGVETYKEMIAKIEAIPEYEVTEDSRWIERKAA